MFFLFGSRASEKHRFAADIDVGILGEFPIDEKIIYKIKDEIDDSLVPFKVDIIDFTKVDDDFKKFALKNIKVWNQINSIKIK